MLLFYYKCIYTQVRKYIEMERGEADNSVTGQTGFKRKNLGSLGEEATDIHYNILAIFL